MRPGNRWLLLPWIVALAACGRPEPEPARVEAPPEAEPHPASLVTALPRADERTLRFRLRAPGEHPLYLENCNGAFSWGLEHRVAGAWKPAWIGPINGCHSPPIVIAPGESRVFTQAVALDVGEELPADTYRIAVYGLYRTHGDRADHADSREVPHELRASAPFAFGPLSPR